MIRVAFAGLQDAATHRATESSYRISAARTLGAASASPVQATALQLRPLHTLGREIQHFSVNRLVGMRIGLSDCRRFVC
jgi:hypothetical protein